MKDQFELKNKLLKACSLFVDERMLTITTIMASAKSDLESETKSSAGDKRETGRAMLQLEMEKASQQFETVSAMNQVLRKIKIDGKNDIARLGSLIYTSHGNYFLAISIGQVVISGNNFYVVSGSSPIGQLLLGKRENDVVDFNGKAITVLEIF